MMRFEASDFNRDRPRLVGLILFLVTLMVYWPACFHNFISLDDPSFVSQNEIVQRGITREGLQWAFTADVVGNWHPLTMISHMLDCQLFGLNAGMHHFVNALFHAANTVLLFALWFQLTRALWVGAFVAALFAWHPLHVESVAWIAERKDLLSAFFGLLTLRFYVRYAQKRSKVESRESSAGNPTPALDPRLPTRDYLLALAFFAAGLLAKPMLVTLPFVFLLLDFWPLRRLSGPGAGIQPGAIGRVIVEKWPFYLLSVAASVVTFLTQRPEGVVPLAIYPVSLRLGNAAVAYVHYLKNTVWPTNLAVIYPLPQHWPAWQVLTSGVLLFAVSLWVWRARRRSPYWLVGWCWFCGTLVPVIGLVQVGPQAMADRYTYLPLVGVFVAVACGLRDLAARFHLRTAAVSAAAGLVLGGSIIVTELQLRYWKNTERLLTRTLGVTRHNALAHFALATFFAEHQRWAEATLQYREALRIDQSPFSQAVLDRPAIVSAHLLLAQAFELQGHPDEAWAEYREALHLDPDRVETHNNLANLLGKMGRSDEALSHYREAVRLKPDAPPARNNLGNLLIECGHFDEGVQQYAEAARLSPDDPLPHYLMGKAWLRHGEGAKAVMELREASHRNPNDFPIATWLARVLAANESPEIRNGTEAVKTAEQANALSHGVQPLVLDTLAMAYAEAGRFNDAQQTVRKAIDLAQAAGMPDWVREMQRRLQLYQAGHPYREASTNVLSAPGPRINSSAN